MTSCFCWLQLYVIWPTHKTNWSNYPTDWTKNIFFAWPWISIWKMICPIPQYDQYTLSGPLSATTITIGHNQHGPPRPTLSVTTSMVRRNQHSPLDNSWFLSIFIRKIWICPSTMLTTLWTPASRLPPLLPRVERRAARPGRFSPLPRAIWIPWGGGSLRWPASTCRGSPVWLLQGAALEKIVFGFQDDLSFSRPVLETKRPFLKKSYSVNYTGKFVFGF